MAITLRQGEEVVYQGQLSEILSWRHRILFGLASLGVVVHPMAIFLPFALYAFIKIRIAKRYNQYLITTNRLYIELGWFNKTLIEVPLQKINDIGFSQSFFERLFDAGTVSVFTGNDTPIVIGDLSASEVFRNKLSEASSGIKTKVA